MEQHFLSVEEFNEQLKQWHGQTVKITKHEMDDLDKTLLNLNTISYSTDAGTIDDYKSMHTLNLNGDGKIETTANQFEPLPSALYEIPLEDTSLYEFDGTRFIVSTDRAVYKIELT
ncbi:hypothetical protein CIL05_03055 [Virgibacillus profundi]|uniref:Uncharacterized protein n=1 Tax=Virgibacillus profundi TaxID=2024555 RepID=A0A2A2II28_9BACI|nr:hypothetical protein [Virgibacillus profundi]PAV31651.1 hypothetical protein CIL05_03055 [Virgibacillus profundi]PXY55837.1 hypothetical protein CIT14_03065 [Virgibacillus profundi]